MLETQRETTDAKVRFFVCTTLSIHDYDVQVVFYDVNGLRAWKTPSGYRPFWRIDLLRESENFLYAAGWKNIAGVPGARITGLGKLAIVAHAITKPIRSNTTPFSWRALRAGLEGYDLYGASPETWKNFCDN